MLFKVSGARLSFIFPAIVTRPFLTGIVKLLKTDTFFTGAAGSIFFSYNEFAGLR